MKVTIIGDSILEGVRLENGRYRRHGEFVKQVGAEYGLDIDNASKFGSVIDGALERLDKKIENGQLGDYTLLEIGGNDCWFPWDEIASNPKGEYDCATPRAKFNNMYRNMIEKVKAAGSTPIISTIVPVLSHKYLDFVCKGNEQSISQVKKWLVSVDSIWEFQQGYSEMIQSIAEETGCILFDLRSAFPASERECEKYYCHDGIHPNEAGQARMFKKACEFITKLRVKPVLQ